MRKTTLFFLLLLIVLPSCSKSASPGYKMVKPKYHHRWYDRKKDKKTKRTKTVKIVR